MAKAMICKCMSVEEGEIKEAMGSGNLCLDSIGDACGAGTGCGSCHDALEEMLSEQAKRILAKQKRGQVDDQVEIFTRRKD